MASPYRPIEDEDTHGVQTPSTKVSSVLADVSALAGAHRYDESLDALNQLLNDRANPLSQDDLGAALGITFRSRSHAPNQALYRRADALHERLIQLIEATNPRPQPLHKPPSRAGSSAAAPRGSSGGRLAIACLLVAAVVAGAVVLITRGSNTPAGTSDAAPWSQADQNDYMSTCVSNGGSRGWCQCVLPQVMNWFPNITGYDVTLEAISFRFETFPGCKG
jgi:hypothetical protein